MEKYVALLRGINVGGQKKIKMENLRSYMIDLKFGNVKTYIQSGNIVFEYKETDLKALENLINEKILKHYGFQVPVIIKKPKELEEALTKNPFHKDITKDPKRVFITFLSEKPLSDHIIKLEKSDYSPEEYILDNRNIYLFSPEGYRNAKLSNNFFEKKLKVTATTRNLKTINKLIELSKS